jgi:hypothetical protein
MDLHRVRQKSAAVKIAFGLHLSRAKEALTAFLDGRRYNEWERGSFVCGDGRGVAPAAVIARYNPGFENLSGEHHGIGQ